MLCTMKEKIAKDLVSRDGNTIEHYIWGYIMKVLAAIPSSRILGGYKLVTTKLGYS